MNRKVKDFSYILTANITNFILSFISGFILPAILSYSDYNYIKLFTFYIGYVGVMHLGFLDGIFVKFGAYDYDELPKKKFRTYFRFLFILQIIEAIILSIFIIAIGKVDNRMIVNLFVIINMIIMNITSFFTFIYQFTKKFKLFSINLIISKLLYVIGVIALLYFKELNFVYYLILQTIVNIILLVLYLVKNKVLIIGEAESLKKAYPEIKGLMKTGFIIMIGNFIALVILGIDRLFVDYLLTEYDFAMYSFAYSLVTLFFIVLNSLTTVVYPYLARANVDNYNKIYKNVRYGVSISMGFTLCGYFIIKFIVNVFIYKYNDALPIMTFLVPTVLYNAVINILVINTYKALKETKEYFINNIFALVISILANVLAVIIWKDNISISIATLISFFIWTIYSDIYFAKKFNIRLGKIYIFEILILTIFIICALLFNWYIGLIIFLILYLLIVVIGFRKDVIVITKDFLNKN